MLVFLGISNAGLRREPDILLSHLVNLPPALPFLHGRRRCLLRQNPKAVPSAVRMCQIQLMWLHFVGHAALFVKYRRRLSCVLFTNWLQFNRGVDRHDHRHSPKKGDLLPQPSSLGLRKRPMVAFPEVAF